MVARRSYLRSGPGKIPAPDLLRPRGGADGALHCYRGQSPAAGSDRRWRRSDAAAGPPTTCARTPAEYTGEPELPRMVISPLGGCVRCSPIFRKAHGMAFGRLVVSAKLLVGWEGPRSYRSEEIFD